MVFLAKWKNTSGEEASNPVISTLLFCPLVTSLSYPCLIPVLSRPISSRPDLSFFLPLPVLFCPALSIPDLFSAPSFLCFKTSSPIFSIIFGNRVRSASSFAIDKWRSWNFVTQSGFCLITVLNWNHKRVVFIRKRKAVMSLLCPSLKFTNSSILSETSRIALCRKCALVIFHFVRFSSCWFTPSFWANYN